MLLDHKADPNAKTEDGRTPLLEAAFRDKMALVELLLARGAEANAPGYEGSTALHWAVDGGQGKSHHPSHGSRLGLPSGANSLLAGRNWG